MAAELEKATEALKPKQPKQPAGYVCKVKCYFEDRLYEVGDLAEFGPDKKLPDYFQKQPAK